MRETAGNAAATTRCTFVYSELERKGEFIAVLFDGRDEAVARRHENS